MLAPCGKLNMYWGKFHLVHAFFIGVVYCCMLGVWQNVLMTFLCWIGLKWVPLLEFTPDWPCLTCFGQWMCVEHTLPKLCLNAMPCTHYAHTMHPLGTPHAPPAALTCISTCTAQTYTCTIIYFMHCLLLFTPICCYLHVLTLITCCFKFVYSVLSWLYSVLSCFTFCFGLTWI